MILSSMNFRGRAGGWRWPGPKEGAVELSRAGGLVTAGRGKHVRIDGPGVHTRNGDSIELRFDLLQAAGGAVGLAFAGGMEHLKVTLDLKRRRVAIFTSEWNRPQPAAAAPLTLERKGTHTLRIDKTADAGGLVRTANARVRLDGRTALEAAGLNVLPEMGVRVTVSSARVLLRRFVHRGEPSGLPESLHVGGWQMLNRPDLPGNLESIRRGLRAAADAGVRLLVTPETSLTGLFPTRPVTHRSRRVAQAEAQLRRFIRLLKHAPYLVAGLPVWQAAPGRRGKQTRYNVSRVYDPDGDVVLTGAKIHSCESDFWHGYRLHEFEVDAAPVCMHICHDGRYPEVWTLPIMFGARLVIHPCNGGKVSGTVDAFESGAKRQTATMHAFYLRVNGGGGSCLVGPAKRGNLLAVSEECRRDNAAFPQVGRPAECLLHAEIRLTDAFGYWPVRSFRASEAAAAA
ncbi:MAG: hypothetical protein AMJ81_04315, partial [Phycisphaerae bacterium SM23_33]